MSPVSLTCGVLTMQIFVSICSFVGGFVIGYAVMTLALRGLRRLR